MSPARPAQNPATAPLSEILTAAQVAAYLGICARQVLRLPIPALRISPRIVRYRREDVVLWLDQQRAPRGSR